MFLTSHEVGIGIMNTYCGNCNVPDKYDYSGQDDDKDHHETILFNEDATLYDGNKLKYCMFEGQNLYDTFNFTLIKYERQTLFKGIGFMIN